ncbi:MAG: HAMP domain-containing histidine kinase [Streptomycetaceae bacterium]|nr:HAMP domain-containing histidine kinase [Streptomycetaceae bacterium]
MKRPRPPRSLRGRLSAGLVLLLALACAAVGVATALELEGFLVGRLDQQLTASGGRFAASQEHEDRPDADNAPDTRGQSEGTFGARLLGGRVTDSAVVRERSDLAVPLSRSDQRKLAELPPDGKARSIGLSAIGEYRVQAVSGDDGDVLITGLPLHPVEETVHRLEAVETAVFGIALVATGAAAAWWVGFTLRPLRRVAATATAVTRLPLTSGDIAMPRLIDVGDPGTEVGQVGTALNRMIGHVGDALARRQASEERLRNFAADASHELRTPVATVRAHAELGLRSTEPMPPEVRNALQRIQSESERMSVLVDELLLLARLDAGRPLAREPVDLSRLILDAVDDARTVAPDHRWLLDLPEEPVEVPGDRHSLHQVVANLLANAGTHTPRGTTVTVTLAPAPPGQEPPEHVGLTVEDDGPGIPEALLPELFERFTRADPSRTRTGKGTGLGLAIVHAVVTAHHGTVDVTSRPGHTRFRFHLPTDAADERTDHG